MSERTVLWVVGEPGAGKTTLARMLLEPGSRINPKPKWTIGETVVAAGHYTGGKFDGADTVPYNGASEALTFWREVLSRNAALTLLDGDRFSNATAVEFFRSYVLKPRLFCLLVKPAPGLSAQRRQERGSEQNETWIKGRVTKANNFYDGFPTADRATLHTLPEYTPDDLLLRTRVLFDNEGIGKTE